MDSSYLIDINGNAGSDINSRTWQVNIQNLASAPSFAISPDLGVSATDLITSGENVQIEYTTTGANQTVNIYEETLDGKFVQVNSAFHEAVGTYKYVINATGKRNFAVQIEDEFGNTTVFSEKEVYIDTVELTALVTTVKNTEDKCYDYDYVEVTFSEAILPDSFTNDAISFLVSGIEVDGLTFDITQIDATTYTIENINYSGINNLNIVVDLSSIQKLESGLLGTSVVSTDVGISNSNAAFTIEGKIEELEVGEVVKYQIDGKLRNADWLVLNGKIISSSDTTVTVEWLVEGVQLLMLRYQNELGCLETVIQSVAVGEGVTLSVDELVAKGKHMFLSPVPNNGTFSIHSSGTLNDCEILIFDLSGRQIYFEEKIEELNNMKTINMTNIAPGVYSLVMSCQQGNEEITFLIE